MKYKSEVILVYVPSSIGGVRSVTEHIALELASKGHDVRIESSLVSLTVKTISCRLRGNTVFGILSLSSGIISYLFNSSVFIIHGYPVKPFYGFIRANALVNVTRLAKYGGAKLISVSHLARNVHQRIYGIRVDRVIYNGVDSEFFNIKSDQIDKEKIVLYIGRLQSSKGIETIIHAFLNSALIQQGYTLVLAGDGPLRSFVQEHSNRYKSIHYFGGVDEATKISLYSKAEIFVSLYDFEAMGVVYAEALMASCKIVFPIACGASEFIPAYYSHAKCDPYDINSVSEAMESVVKDSTPVLMDKDKSKFSYSSIALAYLNSLSP
jgi:glycosyltransferase involved in cell wall biosynthesis